MLFSLLGLPQNHLIKCVFLQSKRFRDSFVTVRHVIARFVTDNTAFSGQIKALNWLFRHLFWPENCTKNRGTHVARLSGPSGYLLFCDIAAACVNVKVAGFPLERKFHSI